jgi:hypothetical protein
MRRAKGALGHNETIQHYRDCASLGSSPCTPGRYSLIPPGGAGG